MLLWYRRKKKRELEQLLRMRDDNVRCLGPELTLPMP
jgi:hypothetical protein